MNEHQILEQIFKKLKYPERFKEYFSTALNYIEKEYKKKQGYNIVFTGKMDYEPNIQAMRWFCEEIFPKIQKEILDELVK